MVEDIVELVAAPDHRAEVVSTVLLLVLMIGLGAGF
jgi:hypothetical protein